MRYLCMFTYIYALAGQVGIRAIVIFGRAQVIENKAKTLLYFS